MVNSGLTHVNIINGRVEGDSGDGIVVNSGTSQVTITDVTARNGVRGIHLLGTSYATILRCDMSANSTGLEISNCNNITIDTCQATDNNVTGFSLISSATNVIRNCKALVNGLLSTGNSYGFISNNGNSNIFTGCITDGLSTTTTNPNAVVAGFALTGTEMCSEIVNCESCNNVAPNTTNIINSASLVVAPTTYGIWLQQTMVLTNSSQPSSTINTGLSSLNEVVWSPDNSYVVQTQDGNPSTLLIYRYTPSNPQILTLIQTLSVNVNNVRIAISPTGRYLAAISTATATSTLNLYQLNTSNNQFSLIQTISVASSTFDNIDWSPNNNFVAIMGSANVYIYSFTNNQLSLLSTTAHGIDTHTNETAIHFSPNNAFLMLTSADDNLYFYPFNAANGTLGTQTSSLAPGGNDVLQAVWSPNSQFIAYRTTQDFSANNLILASFNSGTGTATTLQTADVGSFADDRGVTWSPNGQFVAVTNVNTATKNFIVYSFNPGLAAPLTAVATMTLPNETGTYPINLSWSPDGQYITICSNTSQLLRLYDALQFPSNNVIKNNTVYCNSAGTTAQPFGVGISGSSVANLIVTNMSYNNNLFNYLFIPTYLVKYCMEPIFRHHCKTHHCQRVPQ